jgi:putative membrane protein
MKNIINKKGFKILAVLLAVLLVSGTVTCVVYASSASSDNSSDEADTTLKDTIENAIKVDKTADTEGKEETVYAIGDANGNTQKLIISEWLKNPKKQSSLQDYTELSDIKNTNGDEKYSSSGSNIYVWDAAGNDIHYQGTINKELPVKVGVTYFLNGKEVKTDDLAGKSGHVKIHFTYTNTQKVSADIDGAKEQISVPFLMVSGAIMDTDKFTNISVSSGQVVNDGSRNVVVGFAFPGLAKSLDITSGDIDIPEDLDIEADTTGFSLDATLTVGMSGMLDNIKIDTDSSLQDLKDAMNDLKDATNDLIDGSSDIYDGTSELYDKSQDLESGVARLLSGAKDLNAGAIEANTGAKSLRAGLGKLSKNSSALNKGAKQIIEAVFASATSQLRAKLVSSGLMTDAQAAKITLTSANYVSVFKSLSSAVTLTPAQVEAQLRSKLSVMTATQQDLTLTIAYDLMAADSSLDYTDAVTESAKIMSDAGTVSAYFTAIGDMSAWSAAHAALITDVATATGKGSADAAPIAAVAWSIDPAGYMAKIANAATLLQHASIASSTTPSSAKITALCTAVANAATSTGNASLDTVKKQLDDVMEFYNGLLIYTGGVNTVYEGSKDLAQGTTLLQGGSKDLYDGINSLYTGSKKLVSGVGELNDGASQLKEGLDEFYDEGIEKLSTDVNVDLTEFLDRMRAVADAGREYKSFAGKLKDMNGSVKFIYRTDSIEEK